MSDESGDGGLQATLWPEMRPPTEHERLEALRATVPYGTPRWANLVARATAAGGRLETLVETLVEVIVEEFSTKGYEGASTNTLLATYRARPVSLAAERFGLSKGGLFSYFVSKAQMLAAAVAYADRRARLGAELHADRVAEGLREGGLLAEAIMLGLSRFDAHGDAHHYLRVIVGHSDTARPSGVTALDAGQLGVFVRPMELAQGASGRLAAVLIQHAVMLRLGGLRRDMVTACVHELLELVWYQKE